MQSIVKSIQKVYQTNFRKKESLPITIAIIFLTAAIAFMFLLLFSGEKTVQAMNFNELSSDQNTIFIVSEYEGKVAVFLKGETSPTIIFETSISTLPQADQEMLKEGIEVTGSSELRILIEDLTS